MKTKRFTTVFNQVCMVGRLAHMTLCLCLVNVLCCIVDQWLNREKRDAIQRKERRRATEEHDTTFGITPYRGLSGEGVRTGWLLHLVQVCVCVCSYVCVEMSTAPANSWIFNRKLCFPYTNFVGVRHSMMHNGMSLCMFGSGRIS